MITAIVATMFSSCKKTETENPQPTPAITHQIIVSQMPQDTLVTGLMMYGFTAPTGWVIDSVYLNATTTEAPMYQDFWLYDINDTVLLYDFTMNTESMYNKWVVPSEAKQGIKVYLAPPNGWVELKFSMSKQ